MHTHLPTHLQIFKHCVCFWEAGFNVLYIFSWLMHFFFYNKSFLLFESENVCFGGIKDNFCPTSSTKLNHAEPEQEQGNILKPLLHFLPYA